MAKSKLPNPREAIPNESVASIMEHLKTVLTDPSWQILFRWTKGMYSETKLVSDNLAEAADLIESGETAEAKARILEARKQLTKWMEV